MLYEQLLCIACIFVIGLETLQLKKSFKDQKQTLRHDCSVCEEGVHGFSLHKQQLVEEMEAMNMSRASV